VFTLLAFIQSSDQKEGECIAITLINTIAAAVFGYGIIDHYYPEMDGLYLMAMAALTLFIGYISKQQKFNRIFDLHFVMTCILVAIAIPVQFDNTIVTVLWVLMTVGLTYAGLKQEHKGLFYVGYIGYVIPIARVLFYDLWWLDSWERWLAVGSGLVGLIAIQQIANKGYKDTPGWMEIYNIIGILIGLVWIPVEIYEQLDGSTAHVANSIAWAIYSICLIFYGVNNKRKLFNWSGVVVFAIVMLKVLIVDLSNLENIFRVIALVVVGAIALVGSFLYVRNKDVINGYI
jgi:uncharacterized membrane protein